MRREQPMHKNSLSCTPSTSTLPLTHTHSGAATVQRWQSCEWCMSAVHVRSAQGVSGLANSLTFILNIFSWQPISFPYWLPDRHTRWAGSPEESHGGWVKESFLVEMCEKKQNKEMDDGWSAALALCLHFLKSHIQTLYLSPRGTNSTLWIMVKFSRCTKNVETYLKIQELLPEKFILVPCLSFGVKKKKHKP